jgi:hypothetical protein
MKLLFNDKFKKIKHQDGMTFFHANNSEYGMIKCFNKSLSTCTEHVMANNDIINIYDKLRELVINFFAYPQNITEIIYIIYAKNGISHRDFNFKSFNNLRNEYVGILLSKSKIKIFYSNDNMVTHFLTHNPAFAEIHEEREKLKRMSKKSIKIYTKIHNYNINKINITKKSIINIIMKEIIFDIFIKYNMMLY